MTLAITQTSPVRPYTAVTPEQDEFYYGQRTQIVYDTQGKADFIDVPLTQDDFLDPQEGDHFVQGSLHDKDVERIRSIIRHIHHNNPAIRVFCDLKMEWGIEGLKNPCPDVAVIPNVVDPDKPRGQFEVAEEGTRPTFVLEMVSPRHVKPDYEEKPHIYEQAGVYEYMIIDSGLRDFDDDIYYTIKGYRLHSGRYQPIAPDERGWLYSEVNQVWIGVSEGRDSYFVLDAETGVEILPDGERAATAEVRAAIAIDRAEAAEDRAETAEQKADAEAAARLAAEQQAQAEAMARLAAEQKADAEASARLAAEQQAQAEATARLTAEQKADAEAAARLAAEQQAQAEAMARLAAEQKAESEATARLVAEQQLREMAAELARLRAAIGQNNQ